MVGGDRETLMRREMGLDLIKINYIHIQSSQKKSVHKLTRRRLLTENRNLLSSINEKRVPSLVAELICV